MNDAWRFILSALLVALGVLAELNLLRSFLRDYRDGRREARARARRWRGHLEQERSAPRPSTPWLQTTRVAALMLAPIVTTGIAHGQEPQSPTSHQQSNDPVPAAASAAEGLSAKSGEPGREVGSPFSLQLNLDFTNAYFYHGIIQEDTGLIAQPAARLTVNLYEHDEFKIDAFLGVWNSFHGQKTGATTHGDFTEYWYEADLIGGFVLTNGKVSLTTSYTFLTSPSDAYETVQELDFTLAYDDSELLGRFALHPYALLGIETGADASDGANSDPGTYLELGLAPGFSLDMGKTPIAITFPASVGLSLHDYYQNAAGEDDTFGFAQVGVKAAIPLPFGDRYGKWTLNAGVSALFLGDHTSDFDGGNREQVIGTIGLQLNF